MIIMINNTLTRGNDCEILTTTLTTDDKEDAMQADNRRERSDTPDHV